VTCNGCDNSSILGFAVAIVRSWTGLGTLWGREDEHDDGHRAGPCEILFAAIQVIAETMRTDFTAG
jgi:hypothetical protein